jgi:hypothetical protein
VRCFWRKWCNTWIKHSASSDIHVYCKCSLILHG